MPDARRVHSGPATAAAVLIVLAAVMLRLVSITAGLPHRLAHDEPFVLGTAVRILQSGDFNPHFFDYGGFTIYLHTMVGIVTFMLGTMSGAWTSLDQFWQGELAGPARIVTALLGAATVGIVYAAAARIGRPVALVAALALALQAGHVRESHFALTDVPLTFLLALTWLLAIRAGEDGRLRAFGWAGLTVGFAAATKIVGAVGIVMPLVVVASLGWRNLAPRLAAVAAGAAVGFLGAAPYNLIALPEFLSSFAALAQEYGEPAGFLESAWIYVKYLRTWFTWSGVLSPAVGWIPLIVSLTGGLALIGGIRSRRDLAVRASLLAFALIYLAVLSKQGSFLYGRYALPLLPAVVVAFGAGVTWIASRFEDQTPISRHRVTAALLLLLLPTAATSVSWLRQHGRVSTLDQAAAWITGHVAPTDGLATEAVLFLPPSYHWLSITRVSERPPAGWRAAGIRYLVTSTAVTEVEPASFRSTRARIERDGQVVTVFGPSPDHPGPTVTVYRLPDP